MKNDIRAAHLLCIGYAQETDNGGIYEIGNGWIHRRILRLANSIDTTSIINVINGEEYLEESTCEFSIELIGPYEECKLVPKDFEFVKLERPHWTDHIKQLRFELQAEVGGEDLDLALCYEVRSGDNRMHKWLEIGELTGWQVGDVVLEELKLSSAVEPVRPAGSADAAGSRFVHGEYSESLAEYWGCTEGIYALGNEQDFEIMFNAASNLSVTQSIGRDSESRVTTGKAVIGTYRGLPEYGFYSYRQALLEECQAQAYALNAPESSASTQSAAQLRSSVYRAAWQTPYQWMDFGELGVWLSSAGELSRSEFLHVLLSLLGILGDQHIASLSDFAPDQQSQDAVKKAADFLVKHSDYFGDYRHLLGNPDGTLVDGHAHFSGDSGFMILVNPGDETTSVELPLKEPGLWLAPTGKQKLSDFSSLEVGVPMDDARTDKAPQIALAPGEVRIIGVNIKVDSQKE